MSLDQRQPLKTFTSPIEEPSSAVSATNESLDISSKPAGTPENPIEKVILLVEEIESTARENSHEAKQLLKNVIAKVENFSPEGLSPVVKKELKNVLKTYFNSIKEAQKEVQKAEKEITRVEQDVTEIQTKIIETNKLIKLGNEEAKTDLVQLKKELGEKVAEKTNLKAAVETFEKSIDKATDDVSRMIKDTFGETPEAEEKTDGTAISTEKSTPKAENVTTKHTGPLTTDQYIGKTAQWKPPVKEKSFDQIAFEQNGKKPIVQKEVASPKSIDNQLAELKKNRPTMPKGATTEGLKTLWQDGISFLDSLSLEELQGYGIIEEGVKTLPEDFDLYALGGRRAADGGLASIVKIQEQLGFTGRAIDGLWGTKSQTAKENGGVKETPTTAVNNLALDTEMNIAGVNSTAPWESMNAQVSNTNNVIKKPSPTPTLIPGHPFITSVENIGTPYKDLKTGESYPTLNLITADGRTEPLILKEGTLYHKMHRGGIDVSYSYEIKNGKIVPKKEKLHYIYKNKIDAIGISEKDLSIVKGVKKDELLSFLNEINTTFKGEDLNNLGVWSYNNIVWLSRENNFSPWVHSLGTHDALDFNDWLRSDEGEAFLDSENETLEEYFENMNK